MTGEATSSSAAQLVAGGRPGSERAARYERSSERGRGRSAPDPAHVMTSELSDASDPAHVMTSELYDAPDPAHVMNSEPV